MSETTQSNGALPVRSMDEILAELEADGPETKIVPAPELRTSFTVRGLTRAEMLHVLRQAGDLSTGRIVNLDRSDELQLTLGVVEPKITPAHYKRLRHRAEANAVLTRLLAAIGDLTNGPTETGPQGQEVSGVDAAYFPADGEVPAPVAANSG